MLVMTTNHIGRLDDLLIRPGRVDIKLEFRLGGKDMLIQLFCIVFRASDGGGYGPQQGKSVEDNNVCCKVFRKLYDIRLQQRINQPPLKMLKVCLITDLNYKLLALATL